MKILNAIIIDDEHHGRKNLSKLLKDYCPEINLVGMASSSAEGKVLIYETKPDVVFLDINMPKVSGLELLESLGDSDFMVVIVSAHSEFGIQAIKLCVIDYLLKPVSIFELQKTVKKLLLSKKPKISKINNTVRDKLLIPHFQGYSVVEVKCITRLTADDNYTNIYLCDNKTITVSKTLKEFEDLLSEDSFVRVHRSDIINIDFLKDYYSSDGGYAMMKDGSKVSVSKSKTQNLLDKIRNHSSVG